MVEASAALDELREPMWRALSVCLYPRRRDRRDAGVCAGTPAAAAAPARPAGEPRRLAELLHRSGRPEADALVDQLRLGLTRPEDRRALIALAGEPGWTVLRAFRIPSAWERDIADLLIRQEAPDSTRLVDELLRLGESLPAADHDGRLLLMRRVDEAMRSDVAAKRPATTDTLIARRQWLSWRLATAVARDEVRSSARFWLTSSVWTRGIEPTYEEWTQVIADLSRALRASDAESVCRRMPTIRGFEKKQRDEVVTTAYDLKGLAMMAPAVGRAAYDWMAHLLRADPRRAAPFLKELLDWAVEQRNPGQPAALWDAIEAMLADVPVEAATSKQGRHIAADALARGRLRVARALDPSRERDEELVGRIVWALRKGDAEPRAGGIPLGTSLAPRSSSTSPVRSPILAARSSSNSIAMAGRRWRRSPTCTTKATTAGLAVEPLPALRLAAVLDARHSLVRSRRAWRWPAARNAIASRSAGGRRSSRG